MSTLTRSMRFFFALNMVACSGNILKSSDKAHTDADHLEAVRVALDDGDYQTAQGELDLIEGASTEKTILQAGATLGLSGFNIWQTIVSVLDTMKSSSSSSKKGVDSYFDAVGDDVFGSGETRTARVAALDLALTQLTAAPDPTVKDVKNLSCFLTGIWALPVIQSLTSAVTAAQSSLAQVAATASGGGITSTECPDLSAFTTSMTALNVAQSSFSQVLQRANACSFLDFTSSAADLNTVEKKVSTFREHADKGCSAPTVTCTGPYCQALSYACVQAVLVDGSAKAGDGQIASCEIAQNCIVSGQCF